MMGKKSIPANVIRFEDPAVKQICVENFGGLNGITNSIYGTVGVSGVAGEVTIEQAAAVVNFNKIFLDCTSKNLNDIRHFVNISKGELGLNYACEEITVNMSTVPSSWCAGDSSGKYALKKITFGDNVVSVLLAAFCYIYNKKVEVILNEGLKTMPSNFQFLNTLGTKPLVLPSTLTTLGSKTFGNILCSAIISRAVSPPVLGGSIFNLNSSNTSILIYVPDESVEAYKSANIWSSYATRIRPLSEYVEP